MEKLYKLIYELKYDLCDLEIWLEDLEHYPDNKERAEDIKELFNDHILVKVEELAESFKEL